MRLTDEQREVMTASGHTLVTGGPGSGKTTVAILKAARIAACNLKPGQQVLFLSFARATVSRIVDAIEYEQGIPREQKQRIVVETYHSFFWRILKAHGYLIGLPRRLQVLTPSDEAVALSDIRTGYGQASKLTEAEKAAKEREESRERVRLARDDGQICFDLFAAYAGNILDGSTRIRRLVATMYPMIIFDEFQDTNAEQWHVVQALGEFSTLLALADPQQRIYDFIGAHPERLNHFRSAFEPTEVDLSAYNHRSTGTDIAVFGDDLLSGDFRRDSYRGVDCRLYKPYEGRAMATLVTTAYAARKRLVDSGRKDWSLAVLVPTKKMTRLVSNAFRRPPGGMTAIPHVAAIELEGPILAAEVIAFLMEPDADGGHFEDFVSLMCKYFQGRGGDTPAKGDINTARSLQRAHDEKLNREAAKKSMRKNSVLVPMHHVYATVRALQFTGDPDADWIEVHHALENGSCTRLHGVAEDARDIRLLDRGTQLRQELSQQWRENGTYADALSVTQRAFARAHFSTNTKPETGVVVMNMHKAKGKQFSEVIIFEGWPRFANYKIVANVDRIVRSNARSEINSQVRQNFRVSVTRSRERTTILTPETDPCVLLRPAA